MKQCPNPNCILYTRLEELPDAYTKCPGCGGQLVDVSMSSGALHTGHLRRPPNISSGTGQRNLDEEFQQAFPEEPFASPVQQAPVAAQPQQAQYDDEYYPYENAPPDESAQVPALGLSRGARIAYVLALLLLLFSCAFFFVVVGSKIFTQGVVSSPDATETAIVALQPVVNTPIAVLPTVPESQLPAIQPSPTAALPPVAPPTIAPSTVAPQSEPPTATAVVAAPPTQALAQPAGTPQPPPTQPQVPTQPQLASPVAPTAPPPQSQPTDDVIDAHMVIGLGAGQSSGDVSAYHSTDEFVLAVQAQFGPGAVTTMKTSWYGPDGLLLYEIPRDFSDAGTYYTGFTLKKSNPWLPGDYRVDIHTNNSPDPAYTVTFSVVP